MGAGNPGNGEGGGLGRGLSRRANQQRLLALSAVVATVWSLRYVPLGPEAVLELRHLDPILSVVGGRPMDFFGHFAVRQLPRYEAHAGVVMVHVVAMSVALTVGSIQFIPGVRRGRPRLHGILGILFSAGAVVGGVSGAWLAVGLPMVGDVAAIAANVFAGAFLAVSVPASVWAAATGRPAGHARWMARSHAVVCTLLTVFALVGLLVALRLPPGTAYATAHVLCLPLNLLLAEWRIARPNV